DLPTEKEIRFQVAVLATISYLAAAFIARFVFDAPLMPELMAHFIFAVAPIWVVEIAVGMLGPFAKHLGFLACVVIYSIALIAATIAFLKLAPKNPQAFVRAAWTGGLVLVMWGLSALVLIPLLGGGLSGRYLRQGPVYTSLSLFIVYAVYGMAV